MTVKDFVLECLDRAGAVVELRGDEIADVLLTPELEHRLNGQSLITLAFDRQALWGEPEAVFVTVGSPLLDTLIEFACERGTTLSGHIHVERLKLKPGQERELVEQTLTFVGCRVRYREREPQAWCCSYVHFNFKVTLLSDERRERVYTIPVDLRDNRPNLSLAERLPTLEIHDHKQAMGIPDAKRLSIEAAYQTARQVLSRLVDEVIAQYQTRLRRRLEVELSRVISYYDSVVEQMQTRKQREGLTAEQIQSLEQRIAVARVEKENKVREIAEKYRLRARAKLISARLLTQPKVYFDLMIDRKQFTKQLTLAYDPLLNRLEPPLCEVCHQETRRIQVSPQGQLVCQTCADG